MQPMHPIHVLFLAGSVPVFLGALFSDAAYSATFEIQWKNFASWALAWGLLLAGVALAWSLVALRRIDGRSPRRLASLALLAGAVVAGFVNALVHAGDAWAGMPAGMLLSVLVVALALAAAWFGLHVPLVPRPAR